MEFVVEQQQQCMLFICMGFAVVVLEVLLVPRQALNGFNTSKSMNAACVVAVW